MSATDTDNPIILKLRHEEIVIRQRYETLSIANDFFIAIWFLTGSILFLYPVDETIAVWCFIVGSFQFLVRPSIRLIGHIHLQRIPANSWDG
ncbi:MAG TPA: YrhK family protein [Pseudomonadales bacterium]|nr:YrhK family protein [Pseudomonadales bacterium]